MSKLWASGVTVDYNDEGWCAKVIFYDGRLSNIKCNGELETYDRHQSIEAAVFCVSKLAAAIGVDVGDSLYYDLDGRSELCPPPDGWRVMIEIAAKLLGLNSPYNKGGGN